jgi:hypothetical protein
VYGTENFMGTWGALGYCVEYGSCAGVYGKGLNVNGTWIAYAGLFEGPVVFENNVDVNGYLYKSGGGFKIDHPLDPANKYLYHSFVESPDMKNLYDGVVVLDSNGEAVIQLPEWFEAVNRDFRYQLTAIGAPGPNLYIAQQVSGNQFKIAGGGAGMKVSWQVTGVRQDAYANAHRIPVEEAKAASERGLYRHPEVFGQPPEKQIGQQSTPKMPAPPPRQPIGQVSSATATSAVSMKGN